jgi:hypothetical protein
MMELVTSSVETRLVGETFGASSMTVFVGDSAGGGGGGVIDVVELVPTAVTLGGAFVDAELRFTLAGEPPSACFGLAALAASTAITRNSTD